MVGFKRGRRVLIVGGEGVTLYGPSSRFGMERETSISWEVPNFEDQLAEVLSEKSVGRPVTVLFDGNDQTYRKEDNIPKLSPIDRPRYVKRKLELAFPAYPIRASLEIKPPKKKFGRAPAVKAAPSYLFAALQETEQVDRISAAMLDAGVPIGGFGLLPVESSRLVSELAEKVFAGKGKRSRWALLVGQHETGGLRQLVVKDGNLALTRMTPNSDAGPSGPAWVEDAVRELKATANYISRYGFSSEDGLDVVVICGDIEKQFFKPADMGFAHFHCLNLNEAMRHIGIKASGNEKNNYADALHAAWISKNSSLRLPVRVPSLHRVMAPRLAASVGSLVLTLGVLGFAGLSVESYLGYNRTQNEIALKQNQKALQEREYEKEAAVFDELPIQPAVVRSAMAVKTLLETNTVDLAPILHRLKTAMGGDINLEELSFEHVPGPVLALEGSTGQPRFGFFPDPSDRGTVKIQFKFGMPDKTPLEQKVKRAEQLLESLKGQFPEYKISIMSQFGNFSREGSRTGGVGDIATGGGGGSKDLAQFQMEGAPL
ncbi:MAG: hypothetical protein ACK4PK_06175 [Alphaproteobacteria bacterium]|jgi:hypothetical protein